MNTNIWIRSFHHQCFLLHTPSSLHRYSLLPLFPFSLFSPHSCSVSVISSPPYPLSPSLASFWSAKQWEIHTPLLPRHHPLSRQGHPWCCRSAYGAAAQQNLFLVRKGDGGLPAATLAAAAPGPLGHRGAHDFRNFAAKHARGRPSSSAKCSILPEWKCWRRSRCSPGFKGKGNMRGVDPILGKCHFRICGGPTPAAVELLDLIFIVFGMQGW